MGRTKRPPKHTEAVLALLKRCAEEMRTVTYADVSAELNISGQQWLRWPLWYIRDEVCRKKNLPELNMLVVRKDERRPGRGHLHPSLKITGRTDKEWYWRGIVLQVFAHDWSGVELP